VKELKKLESFKKKDYKSALQECFMRMDQLMLSKEGRKDLLKIQSSQQRVEQDENMD
jgi:hypothetical protein